MSKCILFFFYFILLILLYDLSLSHAHTHTCHYLTIVQYIQMQRQQQKLTRLGFVLNDSQLISWRFRFDIHDIGNLKITRESFDCKCRFSIFLSWFSSKFLHESVSPYDNSLKQSLESNTRIEQFSVGFDDERKFGIQFFYRNIWTEIHMEIIDLSLFFR